MTAEANIGKSGKASAHIKCEGIRVNGTYCERTLDLEFPVQDEVNGKAYRTPIQARNRARELAKKDGWLVEKGADVCPRIHGFIPLPPEKPKAAKK